MPTEPERNIEKTLKAYARQRREQAGAPLDLHPATRRMLQAEAARVGPRRPGKPGFWAGMAALFKGRIVFVSILVALIVAFGLLFASVLNRVRRQQLASLAQSAKGKLAETDMSTFSTARKSAEAENSSALLADKKSITDVVASVPPQVTTMPTLDQTSTLLAEKQQKDAHLESLALNAPASSPGNALRRDGDLAKTPAVASGTIAPDSSIAAQAAVNSRSGASSLSPAASPAAPAPMLALSQPNESANAFPNRQSIDRPPSFASEAAVLGARSQAESSSYGIQAAHTPIRDAVVLAPPPAASAPLSAFKTDASPAQATPIEGVATFASPDFSVPSSATTQRFFRVTGTVRSASATGFARGKSLLESFRVEQNGDKLRVIDADGSIYAGFVQPLDGAVSGFANFRAVAAADKSESVQPANKIQAGRAVDTVNPSVPAIQGYYFRVTGTNRSLRQSVVFSGTLAPGGAPITGAQMKSRAAAAIGGQTSTKPPDSALLPLSRARLRGSALVGGTNVFEVNAAPATQ